FDAEDLHLMGAIAGFVSALYSACREHDRAKRRERVLQFLIDQLPVGVVCFGKDGGLIAGSSVAWRLLGLEQAPGDVDSAPVLQALRDGVAERGEAHFEVERRLMFVMRREFEPADAEAVSAYVIYDLSQRRQRFQDALDREYYRARCQGTEICLGLIHGSAEPGRIYAAVKAQAETLGISRELVQPIDAYTCGLALPDRRLTAARETLKQVVKAIGPEVGKVALTEFGEEAAGSAASPSEQVLHKALKRLAPRERALLPRLLVLDAYRPVFDTLEIVLDGVIEPVFCACADDLVREIGTGRYEGAVVDLDSLTRSSDLEAVRRACAESEHPVQIFYSSTKRREMLVNRIDREAAQRLLLKPFEALAVQRVVGACFDSA
ncbi:MAG: hypothetical protein ACOCVJ_04085, partial [Verrucomicrobiota bacterium]